MLNRSEIEKIQFAQQQLYKRQLKNLDNLTLKRSQSPYSYHVKEVYIDNQEDISITEKLQNSALAFSKALLHVKGRTMFTLKGSADGHVKLSVGNFQSAAAYKSLCSTFSGSVVAESDAMEGGQWSHYAALVYTPSLDVEEQQNFIGVFDSFLKGTMYKEFEVRIVVNPVDLSDTLLEMSKLYEGAYPLQKLQIANSISESYQLQEGENTANTESAILISKNMSKNMSRTEGKDSSENTTTDYESYAIEQYCEHLKFLMDRQLRANSIGQFQVAIYIGAKEETVIANLQSSIQQSSFETSFGEPVKITQHVRVKDLFESSEFPADESVQSVTLGYLSGVTSVLTSQELARLIQLPSLSFNGYEVKQQNDFEVSALPNDAGEVQWNMGKQFVRNVLSENEVSYSYSKLRQHCLISGITGSGKTNTVMSLLKDSPVPYLIIEPTKQEYRHLLSIDPDIKLYTLGNETVSPIRLNPFYFPVGVSVMSHIDSLKAVFMSAFSMYASMPNILEQCLYSIYQKVGWDLNLSINVFATEGLQNEHYPTLELLYTEIDTYLEQSGYAEEQKSNIRAALLTRIKSLMTGSKGKLLNTIETIDFSDLLQSKVIIELEEVADEDDKALIMGLFFIRLSEQFKIEAEQTLDSELKHFTIIEEAHRLFKNHSENQNPEVANTKGKAVEFFCNILSEIRSKGEGIIIVDQVPTKLAPDALKNTDTKIIHRLVSKDDAEYVSQALAIEEEDMLFLSQLKRGEVLFFTSGMYKAGHVLMNPAKEALSYMPVEDIRTAVKQYNTFVQAEEHVHPMAEYLLAQNEKLIDSMLVQYRKYYHSALYGEMADINVAVTAYTQSLLKMTSKIGYIIPQEQQVSYVATLSKGLTDLYLKRYAYFKNYVNVREEVRYYLDLLLSNADYKWEQEELNVLAEQRQARIYSLLVGATELSLFDESYMQWLEPTRQVVDGEIQILANVFERNGVLQIIQPGKSASSNAMKVYELAKKLLINEFIIWHWNKQTKALLLRTLKYIFGNEQKPLLTQMEIWIERDVNEWNYSQV